MKWKEFFKPTMIKIILFLILAIPTSLFFGHHTYKSIWSIGFPFGIHGCNFLSNNTPSICYPRPFYEIFNIDVDLNNNSQWRLEGILLNIVFWYLISCLIVWIYNKTKKKKTQSEEKFI
jgi:hypothetical protein